MRNIFFALVLVFMGIQVNSQQPNPQNIEIAKRFVYFLDNGFEKIDLLKVPSVKRSFFSIGKPQLIIADKNDRSKKNLVNSYTILVKEGGNDEHGKSYANPSPFTTSTCNSVIASQKPKATITFLEIKLNVTLPTTGSKYNNPIGSLPVGFFLYLD
ncbi:MAG: hypothetical protein ACOVP1_03805 [Bacteroidia bacterium]